MSKLIGSCPHFFVSDVVRSVDFYKDVLGFACDRLWGDPPCFAMPCRDGFIVMLNQADGHEPAPNGAAECWDAYFWCTGVDALFEAMKSKGVDVVHPPMDQESYGMREFAVRDPDGYMLAFAEDLDPA